MAQISIRPKFLAWVVVAILAFTLACGRESPAPPPPAPPPPFQPQVVVVDLGANGGKTTLVSTQAGGWTRNGEAFASGSTVQGENDATYKLTFSDGRWTAEFVPPDPENVLLGGSGDEVSIQKQEDGSYVFGDEPLQEGQLVDADNGNQYRFTQGDDGRWTAEYVPPEPTRVRLGSSGEFASLIRQEDGTLTLDGTPLVSGEVRVTANENRYRFTLRADGQWVAEFVSAPAVTVALGNSGDTVAVTLLEDRSYVLDGEPLVNGQERDFESGNRYRFELAADGTWRATYVPVTVTVELGARGGSIELTRLESGTYTRNGSPVENGQIVVGNGRSYRLEFADGRWAAEHVQDTIEVRVPSEDVTITLVQREDGRFEHDDTVVESGDEVTVGESTFELRFANGRWTAEFIEERITVEVGARGDSVIVVRLADGNHEYNGRIYRSRSFITGPINGIRYRLTLRNDGTWTSRVWIPPTPGNGGSGNGGGSGTGGTPTTDENLEEAVPSSFLRTGVTLNQQSDLVAVEINDAEDADGTTIDYSAYGGSGAVQSETYVAAARKVLQEAVDQLKRLESEDLPDVAREVIQTTWWPKVRDALNGIFTNGGTTILRALPSDVEDIDEERYLDDFEDLLGALENLESFRREMRAGRELGEFSNQREHAEEIFNASKGSLALGATANTRFGVIAERGADASAQSVATDDPPPALEIRAFAWSPKPMSRITALPSRGEARYTGQTFAIETEGGDVYSGTITVRAWLAIERIDADITNLTSTKDDSVWEHEGRAVTKISLPRITQAALGADADGGADFTVSGSTAGITVQGSVFERDVTGSEFTGYFVGDKGNEVFGTWKVGTLLDGAFGATRQSVSRVTLPNPSGRTVEYEDISGLSYAAGDGTDGTAGGTIEIPNAPSEFSDGDNETDHVFKLSDLYSRTTIARYRDITPQGQTERVRHTLTVRLRRTSYTRFGAWAYTVAGDATQGGEGIFGYSNLAASNIAADNHPRNAVASYRGRTVAVTDDGKLFDGSFELSVDWDDSALGGTVESTIRGMTAVSGGARLRIGGDEVSLIAFQANVTGGDEFTAPTATLIRYTTGTEQAVTSGATLSGQFIGESLDGPVAVVGKWGLDITGLTINGQFGADIVPEP